MTESSTSPSREKTTHSFLHNNSSEDDPYHALTPMPGQAGHLPMAFRPMYHFDAKKQDWIAKMPTASPLDASLLTHFNLLTWNIDFMQPHGEERYIAAINFIERFLTHGGASKSSNGIDLNDVASSTVLLFQEIDQRLLEFITGHRFVREFFMITDISGDTWLNDDNVYGLVTLIPKALSNNVASIFRTNFPGTRMGREAVYVDLLLPNTEELSVALCSPEVDPDTREHPQKSRQNCYLRIANVHLESLRGRSDAERIEQLGSTAPFLAAPGVRVGVVAGDMNPIGPDDPDLPARLGLVDTWAVDVRRKKEQEGCIYITDQGIDDDPLGHTWGYQPPTRFSPRRMDKVLMRGDVDVLGVEKIADKLEVRVDDDGEMVTVWVTDHCGLFARLRIR